MEVLVASHVAGLKEAVCAWLVDRFETVAPHRNLDPESWSDNAFLSDYVKSIRFCEIEGDDQRTL